MFLLRWFLRGSRVCDYDLRRSASGSANECQGLLWGCMRRIMGRGKGRLRLILVTGSIKGRGSTLVMVSFTRAMGRAEGKSSCVG